MKILIHDYPGHPFQVQLARQLVKRGHLVKLAYAGYNTTPRGILTKQKNDLDNFSISPIYIKEPLEKYNFIKRWSQEREYGKLLAEAIIDYNADIFISANTPLDAQYFALRAAKSQGTSFIFWLQDIIGIATQKLLKKRMPIIGNWIGEYYIAMEKSLLRKCDHVITITDDFLPLLHDWHLPEEKVTIIPNWAPLDDLPVRPKINSWSKQHELDNKFCFMYTGTLGMKHDPNALLKLSLHYRDKAEVRIVVASEGPGINWLVDKKRKNDLENLILLDFQPFDQLPDVMGTADVLIALLEPDAGIFSVPSKVLSYLCAQRPVLAAIPRENLAARIIINEHAGFVVTPHDLGDFLSSADQLFLNSNIRKRMGINARSYAEINFNIIKISNQFEKIFKDVL